VLAGGAILSLAFAIGLILSKQARARRKMKDDFDARLHKDDQVLLKLAHAIKYQHQQREQVFDRAKEELRNNIELYRNAADNIRDVIVQVRESQKAEFLRSYLIRDYFRKIPTLNVSQVVMLESYGIETANDIDRVKLYGVPGVDPETVMELMQWRREVEPGFVFHPEHGVTLENVGAAKELAVRRFKISQARKIISSSKQNATMADVGNSELARALTQFDAAVEQWRGVAKQYRDFQSNRRPLERLINTAPSYTLAIALGVPFLAWLLHLMFG
jgi:DNA-binding helix-hairpin-helix protein with protein kinase domain